MTKQVSNKSETNIADIRNLHEDALTQFQTYYDTGNANANYMKGRHWSKDERDKIIQKKQQPYSIPLTAVKLNRLLSEQRNNRWDWKARGRGIEDEITAEVGNCLMKYIDDNNNFKFVESEVYQDGLAKKYGVLEVSVDFSEDVRGEVKLKKIPFNEVLWDTNSKLYDLSDAEFFERFVWTTKRKLKLEFPEKTKEIDALSLDNSNNLSSDKSIKQWFRSEKGKDLVKIVYHYERINKKIVTVKNTMSGTDPSDFESKDEAEKYITEEIKKSQGQLSKKHFGIISRTKEYWNLTVFSNNTILEEKEIDYLPYRVFFCFFDDGDFWNIVDLARDTQIMYDRYLMMMDKATTKNIRGNNYQLNPELLHPQETKDLNKLQADLVDGGKVVLSQTQNQIFQPIGKNENIQVESQMFQIAQALLEDIFGGRTFQGLDANKKQTATESKILENQAKVSVFLYLDNLVRFKISVGELIWELIGKVYTQDRQVRILGESLSQELKQYFQQKQLYVPSQTEPESYGYINLTGLPKTIASTKADIIIDKVEANPSMKIVKYQQLMNLNQYFAQVYQEPIPMETLVEYMDIDYTIKQKLITWQTEKKKQQQMQAQQQQERENVKQANEVLKVTGNQQQPQEQKQEPIKATVSG